MLDFVIMLKEIKRKSASEAAVEALRDFIIRKKLKPGDSFPTEFELMKALNVGRSVVREAIAHFRTLGIIESRPKTGMRIKQLMPDCPFDTYLPYLESDSTAVGELFQVRFIIESGMVPFIIRKASEKDVAELDSIARRMNTDDLALRVEMDKAFHLKLLDIVGNAMLKKVYPLFDYFEKSTKTLSRKSSKTPKEISLEHLAIVDAVRNGDPEAFREMLLSKHYKKGAKEK